MGEHLAAYPAVDETDHKGGEALEEHLASLNHQEAERQEE